MLFNINDEIVLKPSMLMRYTPNSDFQVDVNANAYFQEAIMFGVSYRMQDAVVGMAQYNINRQFSVGYAYDFSLSDLGNYNNGSHELMLQYTFGYRIKSLNPRYF